jgi:hypothetical protein
VEQVSFQSVGRWELSGNYSPKEIRRKNQNSQAIENRPDGVTCFLFPAFFLEKLINKENADHYHRPNKNIDRGKRQLGNSFVDQVPDTREKASGVNLFCFFRILDSKVSDDQTDQT